MRNNYIQEIVITVLLVSLLVFFVNPFNFWMPTEMEFMTVCGALIVYTLFTTLFWKEQARDEREELHKLRAGHIAFYVGALVMVVGLIVQHVKMEMIDPWLVYALGAMVVSKVVVRIYTSEKG